MRTERAIYPSVTRLKDEVIKSTEVVTPESELKFDRTRHNWRQQKWPTQWREKKRGLGGQWRLSEFHKTSFATGDGNRILNEKCSEIAWQRTPILLAGGPPGNDG